MKRLNRKSVRTNTSKFVLTAAAVASLSQVGYGATASWVGNTDALWQTGTNWTAGSGVGGAALAGDALSFDVAGSSGTTLTNDFPAATNFGGLTFTAAAAGYTINGAGITLGGDIAQNAPLTETLNLGLALSASRQVTVASGGSLILGGIISGTGFNLTKTGGGILTLGANNTFAGNTIVDGGTVIYSADNTGVKVLTLGAANQSANTSSISIGANVTTTGLFVQTNSATANRFDIASGKTLTVNGVATFGSTTSATDTGIVTNVSLNGLGSLVVNQNNQLFVIGVSRPNESPSTTDPVVNFDMTGLSNFSYTGTGTSEFRAYFGGNISGTTRLANAGNFISVGTMSVNNSNNANNGGNSTLTLGAGSNVIQANQLSIGAGKSHAVFRFETSTGTLLLTGQAGGASKVNITLGSESSGSANSATSSFQSGIL